MDERVGILFTAHTTAAASGTAVTGRKKGDELDIDLRECVSCGNSSYPCGEMGSLCYGPPRVPVLVHAGTMRNLCHPGGLLV